MGYNWGLLLRIHLTGAGGEQPGRQRTCEQYVAAGAWRTAWPSLLQQTSACVQAADTDGRGAHGDGSAMPWPYRGAGIGGAELPCCAREQHGMAHDRGESTCLY
jgi:hypothetical protein